MRGAEAQPCRMAAMQPRERALGSRLTRQTPPSEKGDALRLEPLLAVDHLDPDPLPGAERVDAAAPQSGDVDEHVLAAAIRRDEAVAFFGLEPLDRTLQRCRRTERPAVAAARGGHRGAQ